MKHIKALCLLITLVLMSFSCSALAQSASLPENEKVLRIVKGELYAMTWPEAFVAFATQHPDVKIMSIEKGLEDSGEIMMAMTTGSEVADLYAIHISSGLAALKDKGFVTNLSSSSILKDTIATFYPFLQEVVTHEGKIIGFPAYFYLHAWAVDQKRWDAMGLGPIPVTFAEYIKKLEEWNKTYGQEKEIVFMEARTTKADLMEGLLERYILQNETAESPLSFNVLDFRNAAELVLRMEEGIAEDRESNEYLNRPLLLTAYPQPLGKEDYGGYQLLPAQLILPPQVSSNKPPAVYGDLEVLVVNPRSPSKELALSFLECMAQHIPSAFRIQFNPNENVPVVAPVSLQKAQTYQEQLSKYEKNLSATHDDKKKDLEQAIAQLQAKLDAALQDHMISPEEIAAYRAVAPYTAFGERSQFLGYGDRDAFESLMAAARRYLDGQMSLDQYIAEIDGIARLLFLEEQ